MKAMIMSDLLIAKKYLPQQLGISIIVGVFITIMLGNLYIATPAVGVMIPFSLIIMTLAIDERANWQQFRLALPISRTDVIVGRYVSFVLLALFGIAVGLLTTVLVIVAAQIAPGIPQLADLMANFSWQALVMVSVIGVSIILVMLSIVMPVFSRFGMTKGVRYLPLLIIFGVWFGFTAMQGDAPPEFFTNALQLMETASGTLLLGAGILLAVAAIYAVSAALSARLYKRREL